MPSLGFNLSAITSIQELDKLSNEELLCISENESLLDFLVFNCHQNQLEFLLNQRQTYIDHLSLAANENILLKRSFEEKKSACMEKHRQFIMHKEKLDESYSLYNEFHKSKDIQHLIDNFKVATLQNEESTEDICNRFLKGNLKVDNFIELFIGLKSHYYKLKAKEEKCLLTSYNITKT